MSNIDRTALLSEIVGFAQTDLLCYRAPRTDFSSPPEGERDVPLHIRGGELPRIDALRVPPAEMQGHFDSPSRGELSVRQAEAFDPILEWVKVTYGVSFSITDSIMPIAQDVAAIAAVQKEFAAASDSQLLVLAELCGILGSALLTLALWKRAITPDQAIKAARVDEACHAERYGLDPVVEAKWAQLEKIVTRCAHTLELHD